MALSAALHVLALSVLDLPARPSPQPRAVLDLSLVTPIGPSAVVANPPAPAVASPSQSAATTDNDPREAVPIAPLATRAEEPSAKAPPAEDETPNPLAGKSALQLARALAAGLAEAPLPSAGGRVLRLTDAPARPDYAYYLRAWRRQVERVGKLNYPGEARRRKLTGSLRLLVVIRADGELADARLVESSGHAVLDDAALRIVRLAAPYAPFPPRIAAQADTLEIERTWRFRGDGGAFL